MRTCPSERPLALRVLASLSIAFAAFVASAACSSSDSSAPPGSSNADAAAGGPSADGAAGSTSSRSNGSGSSGSTGSGPSASRTSSGSGGSSSIGGSTGGGSSTGSSTSSGADAGGGSDGGPVGNDAAPPPTDGGLAGAAPLTGLGGTPSRPQLTPSQAGGFTIANVLAQKGTLGALTTDSWNPTAGLDVSSFTATYTVGPSGATYTTVQAAVSAAAAAGGSNRVYIRIAPGTYTEQVCIKASSPPITLYSTSADATQTVIQFADFQGGLATLGTNPCGGDSNQQASTLVAFNAGFQAKNLTIQNTVTNAQLGSSAATQATALATTGDQVILDNVRVLSHQDTLYVDAPSGTVARVYVKNSLIAGDVDWIFGAATAVFDGCTIEFLSDRHPSSGQPLAPDTDDRNAYGYLVVDSAFTADANTGAGVVALGRAWDHSCADVPTYVNTCVASGKYPNGQATVMNSTIDDHYSRTTPWVAAATTKRGYSSTSWACSTGLTCPANRFYEYGDSGAGSASGM